MRQGGETSLEILECSEFLEFNGSQFCRRFNIASSRYSLTASWLWIYGLAENFGCMIFGYMIYEDFGYMKTYDI